MPMETMGFKDKESRDALWRRWREEKSEGLARYSTHLDNLPEIIYAVTRREPMPTVVPETQPSPETSQNETDMIAEGGPADGDGTAPRV